jgi:hypothetical protein
MSLPDSIASVIGVAEVPRRLPSGFQVGPLYLGRLSISLVNATWDQDGLQLSVEVPDRDTRKPILLKFDVRFRRHAVTAEDVERELRRAVTEIVAHEVAELLLAHGRRRDPHAPVAIESFEADIVFDAGEPLAFDQLTDKRGALG